ncbi:MAG: MATE family efflux transporter [Alistipes sp.]|nr:MATE family efflux transporter [Alistipes sp.]
MFTEKRRSAGFLAMLPVILSLALPTMIEQILHTAVQYIDTAMVGSLGTSATAAVGATTTVNWLISSTISAIGVGFLAVISQAIGAGKPEKARKAAAQAVTTSLITGVLFTAVTLSLSGVIPVWMQVDPGIRKLASRYFLILYTPMLFRTANTIFGTLLRAAGDTKTPMWVGFTVNIINIILNLLLIYPTRTVSVFGNKFTFLGADMGIEGAAVGSAVSYTVGGIIITAALWRHKTISPRNQRMKPDMAILRPCFRVAFPNMLQRFATSLGYVAFASMINSLGEASTAAHTIANTVESAFYIPGYGMQTASATLAGNAWGEGDSKKIKRLSKAIIPLEIGMMAVSGGLLFCFAPMLMKIFTNDSAVISMGTTVLRMVALSEPFYGVPIVIEGMMQGMGKTAAPFIYNVLGMWCIRIVGTYICTRIFEAGLVSAWGCMIAHNFVLFILFTIHFAAAKFETKK